MIEYNCILVPPGADIIFKHTEAIKMAQKKISAILIGAGNRGKVYTDDMAKYPDLYEVVGVAEPIEARREYIAKLHNIPADRVFASWEDLLALPKFADACIICTMDQIGRAHV